MKNRLGPAVGFAAGCLLSPLCLAFLLGQGDPKKDPPPAQPRDPAAEAVAPRPAPADRPEARPNEHDKSNVFDRPAYVSPALKQQPKQGRMLGFDFGRDPLNAPAPLTSLGEIMRLEEKARPAVMAKQRKLLEARYVLEPKLDPKVKMSRG